MCGGMHVRSCNSYDNASMVKNVKAHSDLVIESFETSLKTRQKQETLVQVWIKNKTLKNMLPKQSLEL